MALLVPPKYLALCQLGWSAPLGVGLHVLRQPPGGYLHAHQCAHVDLVDAARLVEQLDDGVDLMPAPVLASEAHLASPLFEPQLGVPAVVIELPAHRQAGWGP